MSSIKNKLHKRNRAYASMDNDYPLGVVTESNENQIKNAYGKADYYDSEFNGKSEVVESENLLNPNTTDTKHQSNLTSVSYSNNVFTFSSNSSSNINAKFGIDVKGINTIYVKGTKSDKNVGCAIQSITTSTTIIKYASDYGTNTLNFSTSVDVSAYDKVYISFGIGNNTATISNLIVSTKDIPYTPYFSPYIRNNGVKNEVVLKDGNAQEGNANGIYLNGFYQINVSGGYARFVTNGFNFKKGHTYALLRDREVALNTNIQTSNNTNVISMSYRQKYVTKTFDEDTIASKVMVNGTSTEKFKFMVIDITDGLDATTLPYIPSDNKIYTQVVNGTDKFLLKTNDYIRDMDVVKSDKVVRKKARYTFTGNEKFIRQYAVGNFTWYSFAIPNAKNYGAVYLKGINTFNVDFVDNIRTENYGYYMRYDSIYVSLPSTDTPQNYTKGKSTEYELAEPIEEPIMPLRLKQDNTTYLTDGYFTSYANFLNKHLSKGYVENLTHYGKNGVKIIPNQLIPTNLTTLNTSTSSVPSNNMTGSYITKWIGLEGKVGHKVFAKITTTNTSLRLCWYKSGSEGYDFVNGTLLNSSSTPSSQMSGIYTITQDMVWTDGYMQLYYWIYKNMPTGSHTITVQLVDLTDLYGAGNEPSNIITLFADYPILNSNDLREKTETRKELLAVGQGGNLLALEDKTETTINGITYSVKDGVITLNGKSTASCNLFLVLNKKIPIGVYSYKQFKKELGHNAYLALGNGNYSDIKLLITQGDTSGISINFNTEFEYSYFYINIANNVTFNNYKFTPMLVSGNAVPNLFAPYGKYAIENKVVGENLLNTSINPKTANSVDTPYYSFSNNVSTFNKTTTNTTGYDRWNIDLPKGTYTFKLTNFKKISGNGYAIFYADDNDESDREWNAYSRGIDLRNFEGETTTLSVTFTISKKNNANIRLMFAIYNDFSFSCQIMLYRGGANAITQFLPYYEYKNTWLLDEPLYADSKADEKGIEYGWKEVNAWEINYTYDSTNNRFVSYPIGDMPISLQRTLDILCTHYECLKGGEPFNINWDNVIYNGMNDRQLYIHDHRFNDIATFKQYLELNQVKIRYKLANPIIIKQQNLLPKIQSGNSSISVESGELKPDTILEYYSKDYKPQGTTQPIQQVKDTFNKDGMLDWANRKINY